MTKSEKKKRKNKKQKMKLSPNIADSLTNEEIAFVKELYVAAQKQELRAPQADPLAMIVPVYSGDKRRTSISVYTEHWERWNRFKEKYNMHTSTDLLTLALDDLMAKYEGSEE